MKNELEIIKGNDLIQAKRSMHLTSREKKLVSFMVASVSPYDDDFKEYNFPVSDFASFFNITDKNVNKEYERIATGIMSKPFTVENDEEKFTACWLAEAAYDKRSKQMRFRFTPRLKPYLLKLKKYYTRYRMINLINLENCHSEAMYELLKQFESAGQRRIYLDDMRNMLGLGKKYPLYSNLRAKVIEPTVEEINKFTDINISYEELKQGRRIVALHFKIWSDSKNEYISNAIEKHGSDSESKSGVQTKKEMLEEYEVPKELPDNLKPVIQTLVEVYGFDITEAMSTAHQYDHDHITENLSITEKRVRANKEKGIPTDITKYARKAIEIDFRQKKTGLEIQLESEKKERSSSSQNHAVKEFLETYYKGWFRNKLDEFIENSGDNFTEAFEDYLQTHDDLLMHSVREDYRKSGTESIMVKNQLRIFYSEELGLKDKFNMEFFMDDSGYSIVTGPNGDQLFKYGKEINT
jgi:plasmid replication initiation protein